MDTILDYGHYYGHYLDVWTLFLIIDTIMDTTWTLCEIEGHYLETIWTLFGHYMDTIWRLFGQEIIWKLS